MGRTWARWSYGRFVEPFWIETNEIDIPIVDLDPSLDGLRILHMTDFHLCRRVPVALIRQAIDRADHLRCDLIALTGDFVHAGFHFVDAIAEIAGRLSAPLGVFAVLGNHDHAVRMYGRRSRYPALAATVQAALERQGVDVLVNEHRILSPTDRAPLAVAGVDDLWSGNADLSKALEGIPDSMPRVVLAHNPRSIDQLAGRRCDLMLSGHTHGGQVRLRNAPSARPDRSQNRLSAGLYHRSDAYLYVNKGVGYTVRFRYRVRPEIAVFQLRRWEESVKLDTL